jgi:hypothetical protein
MGRFWKLLIVGAIFFSVAIAIQSVASKDVSLNEPAPFPSGM